MNESLHIADTDLTLYAMGALPAAEMETARAHVQVCAHCKEELRQIELALAAYAQTTPEVTPPAGAKQRFMARLRETEMPALPAAKIMEKKPSLLERWFGSPRFSLPLAAALALLLIAVCYDDMRHRAALGPLFDEVRRGRVDSAKLNQIMELLTSQQVQRVALHETPSVTPPPEARVVYAGHNGKLLLTAQNLHLLPAGKVYELWILQPNGGKPLPAGTFEPDSSGNAAMILADEPENVAAAGFAVTIEDTGGSETPTSPIVLSGH
jgi:anti-sigma-K factor RskA